MNRWRYGKRGITSIEIILLVIMLCVLIATGILIHNKYQQEKVINAIRDVVNTESETEEKNEACNDILKVNCAIIQTKIMLELVDSDYKTVKGDITLKDGQFFFYEADIKLCNNFPQSSNGSNRKGEVVISFDDSLERFLINGNALDGGNVLNEPLVASKFKK